MALPNDIKMKWPPEHLAKVYDEYAEHAAWYGGDMIKLASLYRDRIYSPFQEHSFNTAQQVHTEIANLIHVPASADIAGTSARMLFGEHPKIIIPEAHTASPNSEAVKLQDWLNEMVEVTTLMGRFSEGADSGSGLGDTYLKIDWDTDICEYPIINVAQADSAVPEFKFGFLRAVTFWRILSDDGKAVLRHLERHEPGAILSEVYKGTTDALGYPVGLQAHPETMSLLPYIDTGLPGLTCVHIPNSKPNRRHRGSCLGQADTDQLESLMNSLDYAYTSLLRDIRLGMGRIIAPIEFFQTDGNGKWVFDEMRESYLGVDSMQGVGTTGQSITLSQFDIRTEQHLTAAKDFLRQIYVSAAYSPQSFGMDIDGNAESGTALRIRERKSIQTTGLKGDYWSPALNYIVNAALVIAKTKLSASITVLPAKVELQDSVETDISTVAESVEKLKRAEAVSAETRVRMVHPDWNEQQVKEEVQRITDQSGLTVPDIPGVDAGNSPGGSNN